MLVKPVLLLGACLILQTNCYNYGFLDNPFRYWDTSDLFGAESKAAPESRDVEEVTERDREPLAPDYKDPHNFKPKSDKPIVPDVSRPSTSFDSSVIPGGVIDVSADSDDFGFGRLPHIPDFGFSSSFGAGNGGNSDAFPGGFFGLNGFLRPFAEYKPWWKGENICIEREETTDDEDGPSELHAKKTTAEKTPNFFSTSIRLSNCQESPNKYECVTKINNHGVVKTFIVRYKCCYGFKRTENSPGCMKQIELVPLLETIENLKGGEFKSLIGQTDLGNKFINENLTVLVPSDEALTEFSDTMSELNQVEPARRRRQIQNVVSSRQLVLNHVIPGYIDITELENEDVLNSENNKNPIRFNIYPTRDYGKMITANCARVRKENNLASNGIVHVIDGVVSPVTQNILAIIAEHPQLSYLRQALQNANITKNFKPNGHYTIFAPTDEAFNKLEASAKQRLLNGDACASTILQHHIVAHTVCSSAVIGNATTHSVDGALLNLQRTADDILLFENKAKITKADIVATNGVIHLIDSIAIPDAALFLTEALKKENFTKFLNLIEQSGLANEIDSLKNVTLFAPSDKAFEDPEVTKLLDEVTNDKEKLRDLIMYHTTKGELESCNMNNNMQIKTTNDKSLRLNLYATLPMFSSIINRATVNCARVTGYDEKSCSSMIHEVNQILVPPTKSLLDLVNSDKKYETLSRLLKGTDLEEILKDDKQSLTLLAPSDEVLSKLDQEQLDGLLKDKKKASALLKNHILTEVLCCSGVGPHTWGLNTLVSTLSDNHQPISRNGNHIRIGSAALLECDNVATNGVIHTVNKILYPHSSHNPGFGFFIFDL